MTYPQFLAASYTIGIDRLRDQDDGEWRVRVFVPGEFGATLYDVVGWDRDTLLAQANDAITAHTNTLDKERS